MFHAAVAWGDKPFNGHGFFLIPRNEVRQEGGGGGDIGIRAGLHHAVAVIMVTVTVRVEIFREYLPNESQNGGYLPTPGNKPFFFLFFGVWGWGRGGGLLDNFLK